MGICISERRLIENDAIESALLIRMHSNPEIALPNLN